MKVLGIAQKAYDKCEGLSLRYRLSSSQYLSRLITFVTESLHQLGRLSPERVVGCTLQNPDITREHYSRLS